MALSIKLTESHFVALPSQSNVYGLAVLSAVAGANKLLVASLRRPIFCVEYLANKPSDVLLPSSKEVHFTYIPNGAEIISIDSFNKSISSNDFLVGITFSKDKQGDQPVQYFNIYTDWEPKSDFSLDTIAQSCLPLELHFIPYQLYHTEVWKDGAREIVWLLSGSDRSVHMYREDKPHTYSEYVSIENYFPEFAQLPSIVLSMDVVYFEDNRRRLTAFGCEDGFVRAVLVDVSTNEQISTWETKHDCPISCVRLLVLTNHAEVPTFLQIGAVENGDPVNDSGSDHGLLAPEYHLLVASTLEVAVVYWNVVSEGLQDQRMLAGSEGFDCNQCACVADIDMDGQNELILGTYGQQLLVYKYMKRPTPQTPPATSSDSTVRSPQRSAAASVGEFVLVWSRSFAYPLLSIKYVDVTGDGMCELVVLSTKGLHILQHNLNDVAELLTNRLQQLVNTLHMNDAFKELQAEDMTL